METLFYALSDYNLDGISNYEWNNNTIDKNSLNQIYMHEPAQLNLMNDIIRQGESLLWDIYSYRSCAHIIPQNPRVNDSNDIYVATFNALKPEIERIKEFYEFFQNSTDSFKLIMSQKINDSRQFDIYCSPEFVYRMAHILGIFGALDAMKKTKSSMSNDISMFKRALTLLPSDVVPKNVINAELCSLQNLAVFIAQTDNYLNFLDSFSKSKNSIVDHILLDIISRSCYYLENEFNYYLEHKNWLLIAISIGFYLLDSADVATRRKIKVDKIMRILTMNQHILVFGDVCIDLFSILAKCTNSKLGTSQDSSNFFIQNISLCFTITQLRQDHHLFLLAFQNMSKQPQSSYDLIFKIGIMGLKHIKNIAAKIEQQHAWKLGTPSISSPKDALFIDKVIRYNYSPSELEILIELISMMHSVTKMLLQNGDIFEIGVQKYINNEFSVFMNSNIESYLTHLAKKKKSSTATISYLHDICSKTNFQFDASILYLVRSFLSEAIHEKSKGMKSGFLTEKDFKDHQINEIQEFLTKTFSYSSFYKFRENVLNSMDVSFLWFKEFQIGIQNSVEIPIISSLPFILADFASKSKSPQIMRLFLEPFVIYNTASTKILFEIESQHLYDEIESEVNFCFNKLFIRVCQRIYAHFRIRASRLLLSKESLCDMVHRKFEHEALISLLRQKSIQILGRNVQLNELFSSILNRFLRKSIDVAIRRFQSQDISYFKEFRTLLDVSEMTHKLLSKYVVLDSFEQMKTEMDESMSMHNNGRIITHIVHEMLNDFIPNYCYNVATSRFLRSSITYASPAQRVPFSKARVMHLYGSKDITIAFGIENAPYRDIITDAHFDIILKAIETKGLAVLVNHIMEHGCLLIKHVLGIVLPELAQKNPKPIKLPIFEYGTLGTLEYFLAHTKSLLNLENLDSEIYQSFREIGNCGILLNALQLIGSESLSKIDDFTGNISSENHKRFNFVSQYIEKIKNCLSEIPSFGFNGIYENKAFFRLWSYLEFLFVFKKCKENFGDGFHFAGCILNHALNQRRYLETFSLNNHILAVGKQDVKLDKTQETELSTYLKNSQELKDLSQNIFAYLESL